jgi:hypothetical protein
MRKIVWLRWLLQNIGFPQRQATSLDYRNNWSCILMYTQPRVRKVHKAYRCCNWTSYHMNTNNGNIDVTYNCKFWVPAIGKMSKIMAVMISATNPKGALTHLGENKC